MKKRMNLYNKITYSKVNENNKMLLEDYLMELEARGLSPASIYQYKADIRGFLCWLVSHHNNEYILKSKKRTFRMFFLEMMKSGGCSSNRINRYQSSLRGILNFAYLDDDEYKFYNHNVMDRIQSVHKKMVRPIIFLSDKQINILINYCIKHQKYQQALFVSLAYDSAARRRELFQVKKDNFINNKVTNEVRAKRGKHYRLLYFNRTRKIAKLYFKQRGKDNVDSLWFTTEDGKRKAASYQVLYYWVQFLRKALYRETGTYLKFNVHSFRHSALNNYHDSSHHYLKETGKKAMPLEVLKVLANHSSIQTTKNYLKNNDKQKLKNAFGI